MNPSYSYSSLTHTKVDRWVDATYDSSTQIWWGKVLISLILLQLEKLCSISVREGSVLAAPGLPPAKTHFSEPGCSEKQSNSAHASLHMSSISSLSSLHLSLSLPLSISRSPFLGNDLFHRPCALTPGLGSAWRGPAPAAGYVGRGWVLCHHPPASPSVPAVTQSKLKICDWRRWTAFLYSYSPAASRWQRHTEQRSSIKVTTWSDVMAARAARTKAASAPFGIRTRLDRGGHN